MLPIMGILVSPPYYGRKKHGSNTAAAVPSAAHLNPSRRAFLTGSIALGAFVATNTEAYAKSVHLPNLLLPSARGGPDGPSLHKGQIVLVNAWASWCAPCRTEIPAFIELYERYADALTIIGANEGESFSEVTKSVADLAIPYIVLVDRRQLLSAVLMISELPFTIVIGPDGGVIDVVIGVVSFPRLDSVLKRLRPKGVTSPRD